MQTEYTDKHDQKEILCKNCGAKLSFAPGTQHLKCEYCGAMNEIEISKEEIKENDFLEFLDKGIDTAPKEVVNTLKCDACGAETTFEPNVVSEACAFCGNNLVVKNATSHDIIQPKSLLPFKVDNKESIALFQKWLADLWWAPNALKKYARQKKISGMYIPYWTYDSDTTSDYTGQRGDNYQETETYEEDGETKTRIVTRTRWTYVSGRVWENFDDVLILASHSLPKKYIEKLEPWDLESLVPYDGKFLSGFKTESYQVDLKDGFEEAKDKMEVVIRGKIKNDIGGDHQRISSLSTYYDDITFKHILLPVWISAYRYNDKVYRFMVNGRTGEVQGERPYSVIKITLFVLFIISLIVAGYFLYQKYK